MPVQKLRLQHGWSQQQLAELSGLSVRTIQRIENGQTASVETLKSLASVFEIDFSSLSSEPDMSDPTRSTARLEEKLAFARVRKLRGFYIHLMQYAIVIGGLVIINLATTPQYFWFQWPALGWGLGLMTHAAATFHWIPFFTAEWERKQVEKHLGRPL